MTLLIDIGAKATGIVADHWQIYDGSADALTKGQACLLPIEEWIERPVVWQEFAGEIGVVLSASDDPARLQGRLNEVALIALQFTPATDGRGFSQARVLRTQIGFTGLIRALGPVIADQVPLLARCGVNQFELADEQQAQTALRLLRTPLPTYQASYDGAAFIPLPGAARRAAAAAL